MTPIEAAARALALRSAEALGIPGPRQYAEDLWREHREDASAAIAAFLGAAAATEGLAHALYLDRRDGDDQWILPDPERGPLLINRVFFRREATLAIAALARMAKESRHD